MTSRINPKHAPKPDKPLYTGDPDATLTVCTKKLRRHLSRDLLYVPVAIEPDQNTNQAGEDTNAETAPRVEVIVLCKHCKQDPVLYNDQAAT